MVLDDRLEEDELVDVVLVLEVAEDAELVEVADDELEDEWLVDDWLEVDELDELLEVKVSEAAAVDKGLN